MFNGIPKFLLGTYYLQCNKQKPKIPTNNRWYREVIEIKDKYDR